MGSQLRAEAACFVRISNNTILYQQESGLGLEHTHEIVVEAKGRETPAQLGVGKRLNAQIMVVGGTKDTADPVTL